MNPTMKNKRFGKKATAAIMAGLLAAAPIANVFAPVTVALAATSYSSEGATVIDVSQTADVTIKEAGTYVITGTATEGSVKVKKGVCGVTLILRDLTLSNSTVAPLTINKDNGDVVVAIEGGVRLTDLEDAALDDTDDENYEGAAIKVKSGSNLILTGTGTLVADSTADKNGIKVADESTLTIESGTYQISAANDGIHAGNLLITGGTLSVSAGDDGIKAEYDVTIGTQGSASGPSITVTKSTEALEGATVNIHSGNVSLTASDDGINAANADLTNYAFELNITGGTVSVDAQGDGLDSNGNITTSGGTVVVFGAGNNGNAAVDVGDWGSSWNNTGATVIAVGMSGMAVTPTGICAVFGSAAMGGGMGGQTPGDMSGEMPGDMGQMPGGQQGQMGQMPGGQQGQMGQMPGGQQSGMGGQMGGSPMRAMSDDEEASALETEAMGFGGQMGSMDMGAQSGVSISAGATISVTDPTGNVLFSGTAPRQANSVVVTSPSMAEGDVYTLTVNGTSYNATAGQGASGGMGSGMGQMPSQGQQGQMPEQGQMGQMPPDGQQNQSGQLPDGQQGQAPEQGQMPPEQGQQGQMPEQGQQSQAPEQGQEPAQSENLGWNWSANEGWTYREANGRNRTGWLCDEGAWYYLSPAQNGRMTTGWQYVDNAWYLMNASGAMQTGWQFSDGSWYYLNDSGAMLRNQRTPDGYWVGASGAWVR